MITKLSPSNNMQEIEKTLYPPLRLVITNTCNGHCYFCHGEGNKSSNDDNMSLKTISDATLSAKSVGIQDIAITGGEPTLHPELPKIVATIKDIYPEVHLSLTTNGIKLIEFLEASSNEIDSINLSLVSLNEDIFCNYQAVNVMEIVPLLKQWPRTMINVNIIVLRDNLDELQAMISYFIKNNVSIDLLFDLYDESESMASVLSGLVQKLSATYGLFTVQTKHMPYIVFYAGKGLSIRIKHKFITKLWERPLCSRCSLNELCEERICAVRVYPDRSVSPCLNHHIIRYGGELEDNIRETYNQIKLFPNWGESYV